MKRRDFLKYASTTAVLASPAHADAPPPRIKIGQIGIGHAHASKLGVYRKSPDYEVVGIVEPDEGLRKRAALTPAFQGLPWLTREQLLNTPGLQAVLVETRVADLLDNAQACIAAGKHVHTDKPPGDSLPKLRAILDAATKQKLMVQMGYMYRYNPGVILLRDCLKKGWLGEPFDVHAVMGKVVDAGDRRDLAKFPGGIMFELGCHVLDIVIGILGKPTNVVNHARHVSKLDDKLSDHVIGMFEYPKALASVTASAVEVDGTARRHLVVCGTEGTLHIQPLDDPAVRVTFSKSRGDYKRGYQDVKLPKFERYVADAADMAKVIRGEKAHDYPPDHDLAVQDALLRACGMTTM
ncbi:MAG TPA: Gfo/Idh/MocA family oxidoreductase [Gemmataceae bacterium]|jgi:predicted dehydrogenase|nr:Gfo/Idh/MocA family oxidoreductase [Gemmataceae bacterium]